MANKVNGKTINFYKKIFTFFFLIILNFLTAQNSVTEMNTIDSLIKVANQYFMEVKTDRLLEVSKVILQKSKKINYDKGSTYGNYYIACCFSTVGNYKESTKFLNKAQSFSKYLDQDNRQNFRIVGSIADNYRDLELYPLAISKYHETLKILKKIEDYTTIDSLSEGTNYDNLSILYASMNNNDSVYHYLNKDKAILSKIEMEDAYIEKSSCFNGLGEYHLKNNNIDSANYYYDKSLNLLYQKNHPFELDALMGKAKIFTSTNNDTQALKYYFEALEKATFNNFTQVQVSLYEAIAKLYYRDGNTKEANKYQKKYDELSNYLNNRLIQQRNFVLSGVLNQDILNNEVTRKNSTVRMYVVGGIFLCMLGIALYFIDRFRRRNKKVVVESERLLAEKEDVISQQSEETQVLQLKVNESFEEVTQLAKDNSPEFFGRFQEVYPNFVSSLEKISQKMRLTELTLCAYIFLGYNTKDISVYTFKSVHTIRSRKYNLRKKFSLMPEENMELWLKKIISRDL